MYLQECVVRFHFSKAKVRTFHRFHMLTFQAKLKEFCGSFHRFFPPLFTVSHGFLGETGEAFVAPTPLQIFQTGTSAKPDQTIFLLLPHCMLKLQDAHSPLRRLCVKPVDEKALIRRIQRLPLPLVCFPALCCFPFPPSVEHATVCRV